MAFPTDIKYIEAAERELGIKLPESLRNYLLTNNGGEVDTVGLIWRLNPVFDNSSRQHLTLTAINIVSETTAAREWKGFPKEAVAIAADGSGNQLVFLPVTRDPSKLQDTVFVWWREKAELEVAAPNFLLL